MKFVYAILLTIVMSSFALAQNEPKEAEQIIITKKGNGNEKLNIQIDGDKVTVNGNPVSDDKDAEITVRRRKIKDLDVFSEGRVMPFGNDNLIFRQENLMNTLPNKAMLGVGTQKTEDGVEVMNITKGSAAEKAGIKQGDIIIEVDKQKIETPDDLTKIIRDKEPGDKITIVYIRNKKQYTTIAELKKWDAPQFFEFKGGAPYDKQKIEDMMKNLQRDMPNLNNRQFFSFSYPTGPRLGIKIQELENGEGVKVINVQKGSDADKAGIMEGDILKEINGKNALSADEVSGLVRSAKPGETMKIKIDRNGTTKMINLNLTRKVKTADL